MADANTLFDLNGKIALVTGGSRGLGRGGEADEIVGAALYFASNASSFTTGAILGVHGGVA